MAFMPLTFPPHDLLELQRHLEVLTTLQKFMVEAFAESLAEARQKRRQRKLEQIEVPEEHSMINNEVLGGGGFGMVFLADYNAGNAAVKVRTAVGPECSGSTACRVDRVSP